MIRTKHLLIAVCGAVLTASIFGVHLAREGRENVTLKESGPVFTTPKETYGVVVQNEDDRTLRRSAFIASVRSALLRDLSEKKEVPVTIKENPKTSEPQAPIVTLPGPKSLENYGDALPTTTSETILSLETEVGTGVASTSTHE